MIKAIETVYNGYRFRSRLEARWAVFFDALKLRYLYEPEGFEFDGHYYLPDFYLPTIETYIEVKPNTGDGDPTEEKHLAFGKHHRLVILWGEPGNYEGILCWHGWDNLYEWCECSGCGAVDIQFGGRSERIKVHGGAVTGSKGVGVEKAMLKARQARFEHGETPRSNSQSMHESPCALDEDMRLGETGALVGKAGTGKSLTHQYIKELLEEMGGPRAIEKTRDRFGRFR